MRRSRKLGMALLAVMLGATTFVALPANATTGFITIAGGGTISPGLTTTGSPQTFSFNGSGDAATDTYQGSFSCTVNGNDTIGTIAQGSGAFTGNCVAGSTTEPVSGTYSRITDAILIDGNIGPGPLSGSLTGTCSFEATSAPTVTSYDVQCHLVVDTVSVSLNAGYFTIAGGGTSSPGLTIGGGSQTFSFFGSGTAVTATYTGPISCTWNGNDTLGTLLQGSGGFTGNCVAGGITEPVSGSYTRVGLVKLVSGSIGPGPISGNFIGTCSWEPTSGPTVTTYDEQCHYVLT